MGLYKYTAYLACIILFSVFSTYAQEDKPDMKDMFVHPFLAHMSLPDQAGEVSLRLTPFQQREHADIFRDFSIHIEAGIVPNLGLHIRSDALRTDPYSEVMLMYGLLHNKDNSAGVSVFGQISVPTGPDSTNTYKGLFGVAVRETLTKLMVVDANMHFNPKDKMAEYESAFVFKATDLLYPVIEIRGEINSDEVTAYSLLGLKFRIADETAWGIGLQLPVSKTREYDTQVLATLGMAF